MMKWLSGFAYIGMFSAIIGAAYAADKLYLSHNSNNIQNIYGIWSKNLFADASIVQNPAKLVFIAGMAAEDPEDGHIHDPGDVAAQCRIAYGKIKKILSDQGAGMENIVRTVAYLTDMNSKKEYEACQREALAGAPPPPHTLLGVSSLAWPGMVVEVEVTATIPAK